MEENIQELQAIDHNLQNFSMQKQAFQMELTETQNAIDEVNASESDIYKLSGNIMIKADKEKTLQELEEKKKLMELRISSIEKQEALLVSKIDSLKNKENNSDKSR